MHCCVQQQHRRSQKPPIFSIICHVWRIQGDSTSRVRPDSFLDCLVDVRLYRPSVWAIFTNRTSGVAKQFECHDPFLLPDSQPNNLLSRERGTQPLAPRVRGGVRGEDVGAGGLGPSLRHAAQRDGLLATRLARAVDAHGVSLSQWLEQNGAQQGPVETLNGNKH